MSAEDRLIGIERAAWDALASDPTAARRFFGETLASEILMLLPGGLVLDDRERAIDAMSGTPWDDFDLTDLRVLPLGAGVALVSSRVTAHRETQRYEALCSSTYVDDHGTWRLAVHQQTPT